jgi:hypothetical protein
MRCSRCHTHPTVIELAPAKGVVLTLVACCERRWFRDGSSIGIAELLSAIPRRTYRSRMAEVI